MFKPEHKEKIIAALVSGEYEQYQGGLCSITVPKKCCCIGVAYDVVFGDVAGKYGGHESFCTQDAATELGLTQHEETTLVRMNDQEGVSFLGIAEYIRENL